MRGTYPFPVVILIAESVLPLEVWLCEPNVQSSRNMVAYNYKR